jgi:DNA-binding GntR family transcriptional regulator
MSEALVPSVSLPPRTEARSLANGDFHRALYLDCGNGLIISVLHQLRNHTALVSAAVWTTTPSWEHEAAEHRAILGAATSGDADGTAEMLKHHVDDFLRRTFVGEIPARR